MNARTRAARAASPIISLVFDPPSEKATFNLGRVEIIDGKKELVSEVYNKGDTVELTEDEARRAQANWFAPVRINRDRNADSEQRSSAAHVPVPIWRTADGKPWGAVEFDDAIDGAIDAERASNERVAAAVQASDRPRKRPLPAPVVK